MNILVTGGAGFIGSHLCEELLKQGHYVICLDNLFTGSKGNIRHLLNHPNFEFLRHDIVEAITLEVDQIYNLACPAAPIHYQLNPIKTIKCSTVGMVNLLGLAKRCKAKLLQASTSEVYGDPEVHPQPEEYLGKVSCIGPRSCYDEGKRVAESLCVNYHKQNGVDAKIVRIFNTYGPNMALDDGRVVSNFIIQALQNKPIPIYGDGNQTRSFCYVTDLVNGLIVMMNSDEIGPINLGNPSEFTIKALAEKVIAITGSQSQIEYVKFEEDSAYHPKNDPKVRRPDITKAQTLLGWQPIIELEEGLKNTIAYFKKILEKQ